MSKDVRIPFPAIARSKSMSMLRWIGREGCYLGFIRCSAQMVYCTQACIDTMSGQYIGCTYSVKSTGIHDAFTRPECRAKCKKKILNYKGNGPLSRQKERKSRDREKLNEREREKKKERKREREKERDGGGGVLHTKSQSNALRKL